MTVAFMLDLQFVDDIKNLPSSAVKIYLYLMSIADKNGKAKASYAEIMDNTGIKNRNTISPAIYNLAIRGWVGDIKSGYNKANTYHMKFTPMVNQELVDKIIVKSATRKSSSVLSDN